MRTRTIKPLLILAVSIALLLLAGCAKASSNAVSGTVTGSEKDSKSLIVNIAINGKITPLNIARDKGWVEEEFKKLNAEVQWSEFPSGPPLLEALSAGRVDLSFLGDGATIAGIAGGLPFEVVALLSEGKNSVSILVPKDSPIQKLEDLKGKTIGLPKGTTAHVYVAKVLQNTSITLEDLNIINLQPDDGQAAFDSGKLDAWAAWDPYVSNNIASNKARALPAVDVMAPSSAIVRNDFAKEHPELVVAYLKVFKKAALWQLEHEEEAAQIFNEKTKVPVDTIKTILNKGEPLVSPYTEEALAEQQAASDILAGNGFIRKKIIFKDAVNDTFIIEALK